MTTNQLVRNYLDIKEEIAELRSDQDEIIDQLNKRLAGSRWNDNYYLATPYQVRETRVKSYIRRKYSAIRAHRKSNGV